MPSLPPFQDPRERVDDGGDFVEVDRPPMFYDYFNGLFVVFEIEWLPQPMFAHTSAE